MLHPHFGHTLVNCRSCAQDAVFYMPTEVQVQTSGRLIYLD